MIDDPNSTGHDRRKIVERKAFYFRGCWIGWIQDHWIISFFIYSLVPSSVPSHFCPPQTGISQFRSGPILESIPVVAVSRWVFRQIFLVFVVGFVKGGIIDNGRFDLFLLVRLDTFCVNVSLELALDVFGNFLLCFIGTKDDTPVLGSPVIPLRVERRRIVKAVKESHHFLENFGSRRRLGSQFDVQDLDVAGRSAADLAVGGILHPVRVGVHKADLGVGDATGVFLLKILNNVFFGPPVAAAYCV